MEKRKFRWGDVRHYSASDGVLADKNLKQSAPPVVCHFPRAGGGFGKQTTQLHK